MAHLAAGIDPGATYTALVVRQGDEVLQSSTFVRPNDVPHFTWAAIVTARITEVLEQFPGVLVAVEGVSAPKGYNRGMKAPINPKYVMYTALIAGYIAASISPAPVIVPPGRNGSAVGTYPKVLEGRRPKDLPGSGVGAGTRQHEKSAFDVAGQAIMLHRAGYRLDAISSI